MTNPYEHMLGVLHRYHQRGPEVGERLANEMLMSGATVLRDFIDMDVGRPWVYSDKMERFYKETDAFVYELLVWHHRPERAKWRLALTRRITELFPEGAKVLCFGDGIGYDSFALASGCNNVHVTSFEFEGHSARVMEGILQDLRLSDRIGLARVESQLKAGAFDAVICLEVLEHVPDPPALVGKIAGYLKPGGRAFISESFGRVWPKYPTHLASNLKYSGHTLGLFEHVGLMFREFYDMMFEFEKAPRRVGCVDRRLRLYLKGVHDAWYCRRWFADHDIDLASELGRGLDPDNGAGIVMPDGRLNGNGER